jgi:hypothetical protein
MRSFIIFSRADPLQLIPIQSRFNRNYSPFALGLQLLHDKIRG